MTGAWTAAALILAAWLLDLLIGDPPRLPHPVRLLGGAISVLEKVALRFATAPRALIIAGALMSILLCLTAVLAGWMLPLAARALHPAAGTLLELYLIFAMLAGGDLRNHVTPVARHLRRGSLEEARQSVALLVSRDTTELDGSGVSRAALESLFENYADAVVAPLFYAALAGPAGALFFKAVNTLDSMIGYKNKPYLWLGRFAARLDDLLCFLPARLAALLICLAAGSLGAGRRACTVLAADHDSHESPNSAWPEAAAAGALGLRLGGADRYGCTVMERPVINSGGAVPGPGDLDRGLLLFARSSRLAVAVMVLLAFFLRRGGGWPF